MKKLMFMAAIAMVLTVFNACTKDELSSDKQVVSKKPDVYLENGYLAFKNMNAVDSVINLLSKMSRQEKEAWEQMIGLKSARFEFDRLFDEYEKLTSKVEFLKFKSKYADQLKFNEMDETDCSIDYPYQDSFFAPVMNSSGILKVGISLFKFTRENQITILDGDLEKLNNISKFPNDNNIILSTTLKSTNDGSSTTNVTGFLGWRTSGDRRLWNDLNWTKYIYSLSGYPFPTFKVVYIGYLRQQGQKKTLFGWVNYSTQYIVEDIWYQEGNQPKTLIRSGNHISTETTPYYDWGFSYTEYTTPSSSSYDNAIRPTMSCKGNVSFRGFTFTYPITYSEHTGF
ncbi:MAG: hypothetical protein C0397_04275 [Odoribacter sp.]|nr:hypothetical protein [Odoribacter sp.]